MIFIHEAKQISIWKGILSSFLYYPYFYVGFPTKNEKEFNFDLQD